MRINERMKKVVSSLLCLCILAQNTPVFAAAAENNQYTHHTAYTAEGDQGADSGEKEPSTSKQVIIESYDPENWWDFFVKFESAKSGDEIVFKGSQTCNVTFILSEGVKLRGGDWTFTGEITNYGIIASGTFTKSITNNANGIISGGTFTSPVTNNANGTISGGTFKNAVTNNANGTISGGTFKNAVTNNADATISGGTFDNEVKQDGTITGGTFTYKDKKLPNNGAIEGGTFYGVVDNSSKGYYEETYISGGTFHAKVLNTGSIYGGTFHAELVNSYKLYGGTINAVLTCDQSCKIYNLKNDSYQFVVGPFASLDNSQNHSIYCDDHVAIKYSCTSSVKCFFCEATCPPIPHTYENYICTQCQNPCSHASSWWSNGVCTKCQKVCDHASGYSSGTGKCKICDLYCSHATMGTDGCAVCGVKAAARVNNTLYLSLEEALAAATSGDTVTAMADHTITEVPDNILSSLIIPEGVTFDGATYTISVASTGPARLVTCWNRGTIVGGSFKLKVMNDEFGTIRNGIFYKEVENDGTVYGGTYHQKLTNKNKVRNLASENSRFVFGENAIFADESPLSDDMQCDQHVGAGDMDTSGSFACDATIKCILCDTTYGMRFHSVDESGKSCKSCGKVLQARIGQMGYENLVEAIALAKSGDTVTALADYTGKAFTIPSGVTLNVDCYSFKSSDAGDYFCLNGGVIKGGVFETNVKVYSGTIDDSKFEAGVTIDENGSVILNYCVFPEVSQALVIPASTVVNGGIFSGKVSNHGKIYNGIFDKGATNESDGRIYGGNFEHDETDEYYVENKGVIYGGDFKCRVSNKAGTIYGGNFKCNVNYSVLNWSGTIYGGHIEGLLKNYRTIYNLINDPYHITVGSGFTFENISSTGLTCEVHMAPDEVCQNQYNCVLCNTTYTSDSHTYNTDGECTKCGNIAQAMVGYNFYPTMAKALDGAANGDTVIYYGEQDITTAITVPAGVTLKSIVDTVFNGTVTNYGTISTDSNCKGLFTFKGGVINNGAIEGMQDLYGNVTNNGTITIGQMGGTVINYGKLSVMMSTANITNEGTITGGRFISGSVSNNGAITGGTFWCTVTNNGEISGGSFSKAVTNNARIYAGTFESGVEQNSDGTIYGGTFQKDIKGAGTIYNIAGDAYTLKLSSGISCTGTIYCNDHFGGTATCAALSTCTLCKAEYGNTGEHSMIYAADEDADTITCRCQHCESQAVVFALDIPADAVYGSGKLPAAITTGSYSGTMPVVSFKQGEAAVAVPVNAGSYTVTMAWGGETVSGTFLIVPRLLTADDVTITLSRNTDVYNGEEQTPNVTVTVGGTVGGTVLIPDTDYRVVVPADMVNVGKKTLNVLFQNNYANSMMVTYEIVKATPALSWNNQTIVYNGSPVEVAAPTVMLVKGEPFTGSIQYTYGDLDAPPVDAGTYTVTAFVPAYGNYNAAEITAQLLIQQATAPAIQWPTAAELTYGQKLSESVLSSEDAYGSFSWKDGNAIPAVNNSGYTVVYTPEDTANYDYSGVALEKVIQVTVNKAETDYIVPAGLYAVYGQTLADVELPEGWTWVESDLLVGNVGENKFSATYNPDQENYNSQTAELAVTVTPKDITGATIGSFAPMTYNGQMQRPEATVVIDGMTVNGTWSGVINVGDKSTFITDGNFTGSLKADPGMAKKDVTGATIALGKRLTYNGEEQTQTVTGVKVNGLDATFDVSGNRQTNAGEYELIVNGTGNYTGSVNVKWSVAKAAVTITADNKAIYVGAGLPALTYTVSGLMADDKLTKAPALTTNANAAIVGTYAITVVNANAGSNYEISYVDGTLTVMNAETEVEIKIERTAIAEVPDGLKDTKFNTVEAITEELTSWILSVSDGYAEEDMVHYDVTLRFSLDDGNSWILATEENFPTEGITVILPYPEGTNARDYEFVVSHMFTVTSKRLGTAAGDVELPKVEETADGIRVTLNGLSPVTVAARYHDHFGGTASCTEKAVCTICGNGYGEIDKTNHAGGTEVKEVKEATCGAEGYTGDTCCKGCREVIEKGTAIKAAGEHTYGDWNVVKEPTKNKKGERQRACSVCGHVESEEIPVLSDIPATGDNSNIMLYGAMLTMSFAALAVLLLASKKRKQAS